LVLIESPGARIVIVVCTILGVIFATIFRVVGKKNDHAMSILQEPTIIK
jgi:hypothetical protein